MATFSLPQAGGTTRVAVGRTSWKGQELISEYDVPDRVPESDDAVRAYFLRSNGPNLEILEILPRVEADVRAALAKGVA